MVEAVWLRRLWDIYYAHEPPSQNWELARVKVLDQEWTAFKKSRDRRVNFLVLKYVEQK